MATFSINVDVNSKSVNDLEQDLQTLEAQFKTLKIGDPGFTELGQKVQGIRSQLKDVELQFEGLDKEQRATALVDTFQGLVGAVGAVSSAFVAFGGNAEAIEGAEKKLLGVIGVVNGLRDASNGLISAGKLFGPTFTSIGESIKAGFVAGATGAQTFKAALISTGIGALIVAVGLLVANFDKLFGSAEEAAKAIDDINATLERQLFLIDDLNRRRANDAKILEATLKSQGASEQELSKVRQDNYARDRDAAIDAVGKINAAQDAALAKFKGTEKEKQELIDKYNSQRQKAIVDRNNAETNLELEKIALQDKINQKAEENRRKAEANRKDAANKEIKAVKDKNEALRQLDEQRATEGLDAITTEFANNLARLKEAQTEELNQANITEKAKLDIKAKYAALIQANEIQRVKAVGEFEKEATDKTAEEDKARLDAKLEREKAFLALSRQLGDEAAQNAIDAVQRQIDAVAETTVAGVEKIGALQKQLFEKERANAIAAEEQNKADRLTALQDQLNAELALYEGNEQKQLELKSTYATQVEAVTKQSADNIANINEDTNAKIVESDKQTAEAKKQIQQAQLQATLEFAGTVVGALDGIAKEGTEAQKAVDIAKILISAATAAFQAFAQAVALIPPPGGQIVGAALAGVIAIGAARAIADVTKVKPGGGGGAPSKPSTGAIVQPPATTQGTFTPLLPQGGTTIGSGGSQQTSTTGQMGGERVIKTYVLAGDVTDAQEAEARINQRRQF